MRILILAALCTILTGCIASKPEQVRVKPKPGSEVVLNVNPILEITDEDISAEALQKGCYTVDCIPSIDQPKFISADEASEWLKAEDMVFGIDLDGVQRAYPQKILNWHEIVNDKINDQAIVLTFSPLSGSALAFERKVDEVITEFGISGYLYNNNSLIYDRYEGNLWQQVSGEALSGPAAERNEKLTSLPIISVSWEKWLAKHPQSEVLSRENGLDANYNISPYNNYESTDRIHYPVTNFNDDIPIKTAIYGIELNDQSKAYTLEALEREGTIQDQIADTPIEISLEESGKVSVKNLENGEEIQAIRLFWFAWFAFHPNTELYQ